MELDHDRAPARSRGQCRVLPDDRDAAGTDDRARRSRRDGRHRLLRILRVGARGPRPRTVRRRLAQGRGPARHAPRDRRHRRHPVGAVRPAAVRHTGRGPDRPVPRRRPGAPRRAARGDEPRGLPGRQLAAVRPADHPAGRSGEPRPGPPGDRPAGAGRLQRLPGALPRAGRPVRGPGRGAPGARHRLRRVRPLAGRRPAAHRGLPGRPRLLGAARAHPAAGPVAAHGRLRRGHRRGALRPARAPPFPRRLAAVHRAGARGGPDPVGAADRGLRRGGPGLGRGVRLHDQLPGLPAPAGAPGHHRRARRLHQRGDARRRRFGGDLPGPCARPARPARPRRGARLLQRGARAAGADAPARCGRAGRDARGRHQPPRLPGAPARHGPGPGGVLDLADPAGDPRRTAAGAGRRAPRHLGLRRRRVRARFRRRRLRRVRGPAGAAHRRPGQPAHRALRPDPAGRAGAAPAGQRHLRADPVHHPARAVRPAGRTHARRRGRGGLRAAAQLRRTGRVRLADRAHAARARGGPGRAGRRGDGEGLGAVRRGVRDPRGRRRLPAAGRLRAAGAAAPAARRGQGRPDPHAVLAGLPDQLAAHGPPLPGGQGLRDRRRHPARHRADPGGPRVHDLHVRFDGRTEGRDGRPHRCGQPDPRRRGALRGRRAGPAAGHLGAALRRFDLRRLRGAHAGRDRGGAAAVRARRARRVGGPGAGGAGHAVELRTRPDGTPRRRGGGARAARGRPAAGVPAAVGALRRLDPADPAGPAAGAEPADPGRGVGRPHRDDLLVAVPADRRGRPVLDEHPVRQADHQPALLHRRRGVVRAAARRRRRDGRGQRRRPRARLLERRRAHGEPLRAPPGDRRTRLSDG